MMTLNVVHYQEIKDSSKSVIAEITYKIEEANFFFKANLIKNKSGGRFIAAPSKMVEDPLTGESTFTAHWWFPKELRETFQQEARMALETFLAPQIQEKFADSYDPTGIFSPLKNRP